MNQTDNPEISKNTKNNKDARKSPQELYDKYTKKGGEAVMAEDITLAENHYQYADHYLRLMNDPNHFESDPDFHHLIPSPDHSSSAGKRIVQAFKEIAAEKAAKAEAFRQKAVEVAKATKAAWSEKKDKPVKTKSAQAKGLNGQKGVDKKPKNRDEPCKIIFLQSAAHVSGGSSRNQEPGKTSTVTTGAFGYCPES